MKCHGRDAGATATGSALLRIAAVTAVVALLPFWFARIASATTCTYDGEFGIAEVKVGPGEATVLMLGGSGELLVDDIRCGDAARDSMKAISVVGTPGEQTVSISEAGPGGRFSSQFRIALGEGSDRVRLVGDMGDDLSQAGGSRISFDDSPMSLGGVELLEVDVGAGNDGVDAGGIQDAVDVAAAPAPGDALQIPITVHGGDGNDTLAGGDLDDSLFGEGGDDTLDGGSGTDLLIGGPDGDQCFLDGSEIGCEPRIALNPSHGRVGDEATATGDGWYPENGDVLVSLGGSDPQTQEPLSAPVWEAGSFSIVVDVPARDAPGAYAVTACQLCPPFEGNEVARFTFTVDAPTAVLTPTPTPTTGLPTLALRPRSAGAGDRVEAVGRGWSPDEGPVLVSVVTAAGARGPTETVSPSPRGRFHASFLVPDLGRGPYTVRACQHCGASAVIEASALLTVEGTGRSRAPLIVAGIGALLLLAAGGGAALRARRRAPRQTPAAGRVRCELIPQTPRVKVLVAPDGSAHHSVQLVPRTDTGVQRVEEMIGS